jgi:hypothetical protein
MRWSFGQAQAGGRRCGEATSDFMPIRQSHYIPQTNLERHGKCVSGNTGF